MAQKPNIPKSQEQLSQDSISTYKNPESGGEIVFYDPRPHVARGYDMKFRKTTDPTYHAPKTGDLLIFPSYLYHSVRPATHTRVSCALDLYLYNDD